MEHGGVRDADEHRVCCSRPRCSRDREFQVLDESKEEGCLEDCGRFGGDSRCVLNGSFRERLIEEGSVSRSPNRCDVNYCLSQATPIELV